MTRTRRTVVGLAAVLAITALSACSSDDPATEPTGSASSTPTPEAAEIRLWINGSDTPEEAREWLTAAFADANPGSTLVIEEQQWEGLVERLTTSLSSESETPDVVEVGNTQAATFTTAGAFADLTDQLEELGGDDLLPGFVEAGSVEGRTYAVPYYAGSKFVFYREDLFAASGLSVPTTMEEFVDAAVTLKRDNPTPANFSGFWLPGQDWRNGAAFVWDSGGDFAVEDGGQWQGYLSSPESLAGLQTVQRLFMEASGAAKDGNEADPQIAFCAGEAAMLSAPGWLRGVLEDPESGCPDLMANVGVFAMPGSSGEPAPVLLGGSNIAVSANSQHQELAKSLVDLMVSEEFQTIMAENGLTPALESLAPLLGDDEYAEAAIAAASNARLTPPAAGWASVEGSRVLEDLFVAIANGGDVAELATSADESITSSLS
jgi:N,N'-diacetylchitobiose transport system substrate-binding protein